MSDCANCDNRKCMDCVMRYIHNECREDCPDCMGDESRELAASETVTDWAVLDPAKKCDNTVTPQGHRLRRHLRTPHVWLAVHCRDVGGAGTQRSTDASRDGFVARKGRAVSDDLRTRIAAVLPKIFDRIADGELVEWGDMADAVIRELGLIDGDALTEFVSDIQTAFDIGTADD